jgi:hypothetical protein
VLQSAGSSGKVGADLVHAGGSINPKPLEFIFLFREVRVEPAAL